MGTTSVVIAVAIGLLVGAASAAVVVHLRWARRSAEEGAALREALAAGPITLYCGFDPTAPSLHFGNFVQLVALRRFQRAGHKVICLVGGSTGLIGDPKPTSERLMKTKEQTAANVARIKELVRPFLDFEGTDPACAHPAVMVDNLDWTAPLSARVRSKRPNPCRNMASACVR